MRFLLFGTFDRLHPGHEFVLREGLKHGELHVIVARDVTVAKIKDRTADQSQEERLAAIQEKFPEAHVVLGDTEDYLKPVLAIAPDVILLGYDQKLPPGVDMEDLPCPVERLEGFEPERFKSSLRRWK
jgi:cytidyltransferase-like protein